MLILLHSHNRFITRWFLIKTRWSTIILAVIFICHDSDSVFLHDRLWISPWIKSVSNELDIIIHVIASQLSGHCDVISNRLWRHQQNENQTSETRGRCVTVVAFIVIHGFVMSCKKSSVCTLVMNYFCTHSSVILVFISLVASQRGK